MTYRILPRHPRYLRGHFSPPLPPPRSFQIPTWPFQIHPMLNAILDLPQAISDSTQVRYIQGRLGCFPDHLKGYSAHLRCLSGHLRSLWAFSDASLVISGASYSIPIASRALYMPSSPPPKKRPTRSSQVPPCNLRCLQGHIKFVLCHLQMPPRPSQLQLLLNQTTAEIERCKFKNHQLIVSQLTPIISVF